MPYKDREKQKEKNRLYQQKYYQNNKQFYKDKAKERKIKIRKEFNDFKSNLKCEKCGESHVATLDFHHINSNEKEIGISKAIALGWGVERIKKELDKCIVLCSNCHRKLHYNEDIAG